jgi:hypothetical protein
MTPKFIIFNILFAFGLWSGLMLDPISTPKVKIEFSKN